MVLVMIRPLVVMMVVVMTMVVVVMMPLMVGGDAIDGDVVVYDDDGGRGALNWRTCKYLAVWVQAPSFLPNNLKSPLNLQKYIFLILDQPLSMDTMSEYLQ